MKNWVHRIASYSGIAISIVAIGVVIQAVNGNVLREVLGSVKVAWLVPVLLINGVVIISKAYRWQLLVKPLSHISLTQITHILTIGFMANNVLPARLGDAIRIHLLHRKTDLGPAASTGGLIADRILEGLSFLLLAALLFLLGNVPHWMLYGLGVTLLVVAGVYGASVFYSRSRMRHGVFIKLQEGLAPLHNRRVFILGFCTSLVSWSLQLLMIHMTQLAFGVHLPFWGTLMVLVAVNLAVIVPSTPAHLGTFELACVLAYTFLGVDKNVGLLIGATYHLVQVLPVTLIGALLLLVENISLKIGGLAPVPPKSCDAHPGKAGGRAQHIQSTPWRVARETDPDEVCCP